MPLWNTLRGRQKRVLVFRIGCISVPQWLVGLGPSASSRVKRHAGRRA